MTLSLKNQWRYLAMSSASSSSRKQSSLLSLKVTRRVCSTLSCNLCSAMRERGSAKWGVCAYLLPQTEAYCTGVIVPLVEYLKTILGRLPWKSRFLTRLEKVSPVVSAGSYTHSCSALAYCPLLLMPSWLDQREGSMQQTTLGWVSRMLLSETRKGQLVRDCLLSSLLLLSWKRLTSDTKYLGMGRANLLAQPWISWYAEGKESLWGADWRRGVSLGILQFQQAVFCYTMLMISHTILSSLSSSSPATPSQQCGPKRQFLLKSLLSHTLTLPSLSMPTMSSLGRKQPISEYSLWKPWSAAQRMYRFSGRGMSLMQLRRQGVCSMYTLAYILLPQKDCSLVSWKYLVLTMCSSRSRQVKDYRYCSISSPLWNTTPYSSILWSVRALTSSRKRPWAVLLRALSSLSLHCSMEMTGHCGQLLCWLPI